MLKNFNSETDVIIAGSGGHAKVVIEAIKKYHREYNIIGLTDCNASLIGQEVMGIPIVGNDDILMEYYHYGLSKACIAVGNIGSFNTRLDLYNLMKKIGFELINVVHGSSIISDCIKIGEGNVILAGAIININSTIGNSCIINSGCIVEHDCIIGNNVHIAPGAKLSGNVTIGDNCLIGTGASIIQSVRIGHNCIIGAGSVVLHDIPDNSVAAGVPAKIIKKVIL